MCNFLVDTRRWRLSKTVWMVFDSWWWPGLEICGRQIICLCAKSKNPNQFRLDRKNVSSEIVITGISRRFVDLPLTDRSNKQIFTIWDQFTKYTVIYAISNFTAKTCSCLHVYSKICSWNLEYLINFSVIKIRPV